eukprot:TRINITY_DN7467_c0_g6_i1.p1 TRINITY_DN7467_c0_g6~~TRINITY_DN7467_c0_g6_i1.p1  ORF type:complete len:822 (-),score=110.04 TRINITY_DN7467_c0_g6_i1:272-2737(-)
MGSYEPIKTDENHGYVLLPSPCTADGGLQSSTFSAGRDPISPAPGSRNLNSALTASGASVSYVTSIEGGDAMMLGATVPKETAAEVTAVAAISVAATVAVSVAEAGAETGSTVSTAAVSAAERSFYPMPQRPSSLPASTSSPRSNFEVTKGVGPRLFGKDAEGLLSGTLGSLSSPKQLPSSDSIKSTNGTAPARLPRGSSMNSSTSRSTYEQSFPVLRSKSDKPTTAHRAAANRQVAKQVGRGGLMSSLELGKSLQAAWTPKSTFLQPKVPKQEIEKVLEEKEVCSKKARAKRRKSGGLFLAGIRVAAALVTFGDTSESDDDFSSYASSESASETESDLLDFKREEGRELRDVKGRSKEKRTAYSISQEVESGQARAFTLKLEQERKLLGAARSARESRERVLAWIDAEHDRHLRETADAFEAQAKSIAQLRTTVDEKGWNVLLVAPESVVLENDAHHLSSRSRTPRKSAERSVDQKGWNVFGIITEPAVPQNVPEENFKNETDGVVEGSSSSETPRKVVERVKELEAENSAHVSALAAARRDLALEVERVDQARAQATALETECRGLQDVTWETTLEVASQQSDRGLGRMWSDGFIRRGGFGRSLSDRAWEDRVAEIEEELGQLATRIEKRQRLAGDLCDRVTSVHVAQSQFSELELCLESRLRQGMEHYLQQRCQVARLANEKAALVKQLDSALVAFDEESKRATKGQHLIAKSAAQQELLCQSEEDLESGVRFPKKSVSLTSRSRKAAHLENDIESSRFPRGNSSIVPRAVNLARNIGKVVVGGSGSKKKHGIVRSGLWLYVVLLHLWMVFILRTFMV